MARVDFLISNDRHHKAMTWPVIEALAAGERDRWRVLSLCELRGMRSPASAPSGVEIRPVLPLYLRRSTSVGRSSTSGGAGRLRRMLHALSWRLLIGPRLTALLSDRPDLAVLPNDSAFPYDRIARLLSRNGVPFLLLQEGIRFPLPTDCGGPRYGSGGAAAVAAWGAVSREYFRQTGVSPERIHLTGSPYADHMRPPRNEDERRLARTELGLGPRTLVLISNPIDDQGFCTHGEKMALFRRFLDGIAALFAESDFHLAVKLHGRESTADFEPLIPRPLRGRVSVLGNVELTKVLFASSAAVVMASTVGLEALLCGLPLAVLEIPGHGFQYDYVQSGIAIGLAWERPMAPQVASLLEPSEERQRRVGAYLQSQFATRGGASRQVAELIHNLLAGER